MTTPISSTPIALSNSANHALPLHDACIKRDIEAVKKLANKMTLSQKDSKGWSALHYACIRPYAHPGIVKVLLKKKADPEEKTAEGKSSPMAFALADGNDELIDVLLDFGAKIDETLPDGFEPIFQASLLCENIKTLQRMLEHGMDVFAIEEDQNIFEYIKSSGKEFFINPNEIAKLIMDHAKKTDINRYTQYLKKASATK